uniref:Uncharacterized protein n=1 Tax=Leersia perrieri TaxID=77586 RepID=A0A0D9XZ77_9ORYZ
MAAYARNTIRWNRACHMAMLRRATSQRLSVDGEVFLLAADITAARNSVEVEKVIVQRTLRRLLGGAVSSERVASLVERLGTAQMKEADLELEIESMERDYRQLLLYREAAVAAELTEMAALEEIPRLPAATEEEFRLVCEADRRFREDSDSDAQSERSILLFRSNNHSFSDS